MSCHQSGAFTGRRMVFNGGCSSFALSELAWCSCFLLINLRSTWGPFFWHASYSVCTRPKLILLLTFLGIICWTWVRYWLFIFCVTPKTVRFFYKFAFVSIIHHWWIADSLAPLVSFNYFPLLCCTSFLEPKFILHISNYLLLLSLWKLFVVGITTQNHTNLRKKTN